MPLGNGRRAALVEQRLADVENISPRWLQRSLLPESMKNTRKENRKEGKTRILTAVTASFVGNYDKPLLPTCCSHALQQSRGEGGAKGRAEEVAVSGGLRTSAQHRRGLQGQILPHHPPRRRAEPGHGLPRLGGTQLISGMKGDTALAGAGVVEYHRDLAQLTALELIIPVAAAG